MAEAEAEEEDEDEEFENDGIAVELNKVVLVVLADVVGELRILLVIVLKEAELQLAEPLVAAVISFVLLL